MRPRVQVPVLAAAFTLAACTLRPDELLQATGGFCDYRKDMNSLMFHHEGQTASGAPYFKAFGAEKYIYWDPNCHNGPNPTARWIIDNNAPSTTADADLDGDGGKCDYIARFNSDDSSHPPLTATWKMWCGPDGLVPEDRTLSFAYLTTTVTATTTTTHTTTTITVTTTTKTSTSTYTSTTKTTSTKTSTSTSTATTRTTTTPTTTTMTQTRTTTTSSTKTRTTTTSTTRTRTTATKTTTFTTTTPTTTTRSTTLTTTSVTATMTDTSTQSTSTATSVTTPAPTGSTTLKMTATDTTTTATVTVVQNTSGQCCACCRVGATLSCCGGSGDNQDDSDFCCEEDDSDNVTTTLQDTPQATTEEATTPTTQEPTTSSLASSSTPEEATTQATPSSASTTTHHVSVTPKPTYNQALQLTGACQANSKLNGFYELEGTTMSGTPYYKQKWGRYYIYHDPDCNGGTESGKPRWIIDADKPNVNRSMDLDGDEACRYEARTESQAESPPAEAQWFMFCDPWEKVNLLLKEVNLTGLTSTTWLNEAAISSASRLCMWASLPSVGAAALLQFLL